MHACCCRAVHAMRESQQPLATLLLLPQLHAGHDVLTKSQVLDSLRLFFPHISARDVRPLVGPGNFSCDKLRELLFRTETPVSARFPWGEQQAAERAGEEEEMCKHRLQMQGASGARRFGLALTLCPPFVLFLSSRLAGQRLCRPQLGGLQGH